MLAIVIPYYKIRFFEATLESLSLQTHKRFKVYIGNDASVDNPIAIVEKYREQLDIEYRCFKANLGSTALTQQWERCLAMVENEDWVMILGDDDTIDANCVALFHQNIELIKKENINVIRYATQVIDQHNVALSAIYTHPQYENATDFLMRKFRGGTRSSLSEFIFNKNVLEKVKLKNLPLAWFSDTLAILEVSNFGLLYTINGAVVHFRWSGDNITSKIDNLVLKNKASFQFYYYLLDKKASFFNSDQISVLQNKLEKTFLDNKKNSQFWILFTKLYWKKGYNKNYLHFLWKAVLMIIKKMK